MFSKKEHYGTLRQCGSKTESHRVLWPKDSGYFDQEWINGWDISVGPKQRWDLYHLRHFLLESIGFLLIQDNVWSSVLLLCHHFSKHSFKLVPELKFSALRLLSISHKMHCFFFLIISCHIISRQCKHQCHLMNCNGSSLVPGNNFLFSSIMQRLILEW